MARWTLLVLLGIGLSGCATRDSVKSDKPSGRAEAYPVGEAQAKQIARAVLKAEGADEFEEESHYLGADLGWSFGTVGTLTGVWFDALDDGHTSVTIITRRKMAASFATGLRESTFHERFARGAAMARAGQAIPSEL